MTLARDWICVLFHEARVVWHLNERVCLRCHPEREDDCRFEAFAAFIDAMNDVMREMVNAFNRTMETLVAEAPALAAFGDAVRAAFGDRPPCVYGYKLCEICDPTLGPTRWERLRWRVESMCRRAWWRITA